jgi:hypothetical protein
MPGHFHPHWNVVLDWHRQERWRINLEIRHAILVLLQVLGFWVMLSDSPFDESRTVPSSTRDARHPVSTPSPTIPGAWFGIALSLARRRFHRL